MLKKEICFYITANRATAERQKNIRCVQRCNCATTQPRSFFLFVRNNATVIPVHVCVRATAQFLFNSLWEFSHGHNGQRHNGQFFFLFAQRQKNATKIFFFMFARNDMLVVSLLVCVRAMRELWCTCFCVFPHLFQTRHHPQCRSSKLRNNIKFINFLQLPSFGRVFHVTHVLCMRSNRMSLTCVCGNQTLQVTVTHRVEASSIVAPVWEELVVVGENAASVGLKFKEGKRGKRHFSACVRTEGGDSSFSRKDGDEHKD